MSIEITWYLPHRALIIASKDNVTAAHATEVDSELANLFGEQRAPIHLFLEGSLVEQLPSFAVLKRWQWPRQPNLGHVMIYSLRDKSLQVIITIASKLSSVRFHFHKTFDEAATALRKLDPTLPNPSTETYYAIEPLSKPTRQLDSTSHRKLMQVQLIKTAQRRCEFCRVPLPHAVELLAVEIEPDQPPHFENMCLICAHCDKLRQTRGKKFVDPATLKETPLFHPRRQNWQEHFAWSMDALYIVGLTPEGRATIAALRLHAPYHTHLREIGLREGWHPPRKYTADLRSDHFPENGKIRLEIQNLLTSQIDKLVLDPRQPLILGRARTDTFPPSLVDLEPYGGYALGVSRAHARINPPVRHALTLTDLSSANGTFINNQRVQESHRLSHLDEIRLGRLIIRLYFED